MIHLKLNGDASFVKNGLGAAIEDHHNGKVTGAMAHGSSFFLASFNPFFAECLAFTLGLRFARTSNLIAQQIETDTKNVIASFHSRNFSSFEGWPCYVIRDILGLTELL
ncbi:hypothetical protein PanWU01x14_204060 [Parasponia andersonii]|uniref:RNase H type-1 domain-containing protein n=1 Tax=Parasponia andersonii TaxID=3476 RepID=A0A2P5BWJ2_PARAD|nr:hypothetical protein PanWU01x14_204060 [Parasponia andersonii]